MAYLFNSLSDDNATAGKQNIFGGQQTDQGTTTGGPGTETVSYTHLRAHET